MKKTLLYIVFLTISGLLNAQSATGLLGVNRLQLRLNSGGFISDSTGQYALRTSNGMGLLKNCGIWISALDSADNIRTAAHNVLLNTHEFWAGPLQIKDELASNTSFWDKVFAVSREEVEYHRQHYKDLNYIPSAGIAQWPGSAAMGYPYAAVQAPFVDMMSNNQIYEPLNGDYPYISGDAVLYSIANDRYSPAHTYTGGLPLGIELHVNAFAFKGDSALDNCVIVKYSVFNRSARNYKNFRVSAVLNFGIGSIDNELMGTEVNAGAVYAYNDTSEATFKGRLVSVGCMAMNKTISSSMYFENTADAINGAPDSAVHFYNLMNGKWKNGKALNYGSNGVDGSGSAAFVYPDTTDKPNGGFRWQDQVPGSKIGLLNFEGRELAAGQADNYEMLLFYVEDNGFNLKQIGKNCLKIKQALQAKNLLGNPVKTNFDRPVLKVYPNPLKSGEKLWIATGMETPVGIRLIAMDGREISKIDLDSNDNSIILPPDLNPGAYMLEYKTLNMVLNTKLILNH